MQAIVRAGRIPGLTELTVTPETGLGSAQRDGLTDKKLLLKDPDGKCYPDRVARYIFSELYRCSEYIEGTLLYANGSLGKYNLYLLEDAFESIFWGTQGSLQCTWMSSFPLAIGSLLHLLKQPGSGGLHQDALRGTTGADVQTLEKIAESAKAQGIHGIRAVMGIRENLTGSTNQHLYWCLAENGGYYLADAGESSFAFSEQSVDRLVAPLANRLFSMHQKKASEVQNGQNQS